MVKSDLALWKLVGAIIASDVAGVSRMLAKSPELAAAYFCEGASRQAAKNYFLDPIGRYVYAGDTALHIAAAAYRTEIVRILIAAGADVRARNRLGAEPLHSAAVGNPNSSGWNPAAQSATIVRIVEAGADPNAMDKSGVTPLHRAVRSRCAEAVRTLLECGAEPGRKSKSGSTPAFLATQNSGRSGSGSPEAKSQLKAILRLLEQHA
jgi:ankyrin repeat protein